MKTELQWYQLHQELERRIKEWAEKSSKKGGKRTFPPCTLAHEIVEICKRTFVEQEQEQETQNENS